VHIANVPSSYFVACTQPERRTRGIFIYKYDGLISDKLLYTRLIINCYIHTQTAPLREYPLANTYNNKYNYLQVQSCEGLSHALQEHTDISFEQDSS
jgi:hypothetical protein